MFNLFFLVASFALALVAPSIALALPPSGDAATDTLIHSARHGEWVDLAVADGAPKLHTWVSYPERADKAPVVLVIHEIFGMSDWVRATADAFAAEGFIAVAPDMLSGVGPGGGNTESFKGDEVRAAIGKLTNDDVTAKLNAAKDYAIALPAASPKFGVVGFCWGGGQSFAYAARQPKLAAAVVFYGIGPSSPDEIAKIQSPVLGNYGGDDARVTATIDATKKLMADMKKPYEPIIHDKAGHGFLRQQDGKDGANAAAAKASWERTIAFFHEKLDR